MFLILDNEFFFLIPIPVWASSDTMLDSKSLWLAYFNFM